MLERCCGLETRSPAEVAGEPADQLVFVRLAQVAADVRAGLAVGPVISRSGDFYGPVVNVAARLASVASPGEVLATAAVGHEVHATAYRISEAGSRTLTGVDGEVSVVRIERTG
jgi:class 3 adenylate cyclase